MSVVAEPPPLPVQRSNPWKGLHFYTEEDRDIFFGREREADEMLRLVKRDTLSVLFARSGLGKTSLLHAGVVPQLREQGFSPVLLRVGSLLDAQSAVGQVVDTTLVTAAKAEVDVTPVGESPAAMSPTGWSGTLWEFFHAYEFWGKRNDLVTPVLIFDQFEEVFTLDRNGMDASEFLEQLADLAEERVPQSLQRRLGATGERLPFEARSQSYKIVLALREEFVPKLDSLRPFMPAVMRNRFALEPLNAENAMAVVRRAGGEWISEQVARQIVAVVAGEDREVLQPAASSSQDGEIPPAYLSVMCHELFGRMVELGRDKIESDLVAAEHGNILTALYERSFEGLDPKTRVFVEERLLTASGFRGTVPVMEAEHYEGVSSGDLKKLVDKRLLRFEDRLGATHVELSHDLLTRVALKSRTERREQAARDAESQRLEELRRRLRKARLGVTVSTSLALLLLAGYVPQIVPPVRKAFSEWASKLSTRNWPPWLKRLPHWIPPRLQGAPISGPEGWHVYHIEYDKKGFVSAIDTFDTKGEPVTRKSTGVHQWEKLMRPDHWRNGSSTLKGRRSPRETEAITCARTIRPSHETM